MMPPSGHSMPVIVFWDATVSHGHLDADMEDFLNLIRTGTTGQGDRVTVIAGDAFQCFPRITINHNAMTDGIDTYGRVTVTDEPVMNSIEQSAKE